MFSGSVDTKTRVGLAGGNTGHIDQSPTRELQQRHAVFGDIETAQDVGIHLGLNLIQCLPVKLSTNTGAYNLLILQLHDIIKFMQTSIHHKNKYVYQNKGKNFNAIIQVFLIAKLPALFITAHKPAQLGGRFSSI